MVRPKPLASSSAEPPIPQWAIAVIVIATASLIFIVLFGAVTVSAGGSHADLASPQGNVRRPLGRLFDRGCKTNKALADTRTTKDEESLWGEIT